MAMGAIPGAYGMYDPMQLSNLLESWGYKESFRVDLEVSQV